MTLLFSVTTDFVIMAWQDILERCDVWQKLDLSEKNLDDDDARHIAVRLAQNSTVTHLKIDGMFNALQGPGPYGQNGDSGDRVGEPTVNWKHV